MRLAVIAKDSRLTENRTVNHSHVSQVTRVYVSKSNREVLYNDERKINSLTRFNTIFYFIDNSLND